jgi:hypothetical protein
MQDTTVLRQPIFNSRAAGDAFAREAAPVIPEAASAVAFEHEAVVVGPGTTRDFMYEQYSWGLQQLPRHFNKAPRDGTFLHHVAGTARPVHPAGHPQAGQRFGTQWLAFKFRSDGVFTHTGAHVAVILRSQSTAAWNRGRGFIFGHQNLLPDDPNACPTGEQGTAHAQPESWWTVTSGATQTQVNFVWGPPLCSAPAIRDQRDYEIAIHVADGGWIAYWITDIESQAQISISLRDTVNAESDLVDGLTGYSLALVFGASQSASWRVRFYDIGSGWF